MTRRTLIRLASAPVAAAAGIGLYTWRIEPRWLEIVRRPLPVRGLPARLAGRVLVQISAPFLPPPLLPVRNRRYSCGEFELSGNRRMYINRGVGHLPHVRFNVRPEVTAFELRSA